MKNKVIKILFITYIIFLLYLTLFNNYLGRNHGIYDFNLIPFKNIFIIIRDFIQNKTTLEFFIRNMIGNIVAFTPFAYFLPKLFNVSKTKTYLIIIITIITTIEILQYTLKIGVLDIDDIILNTLGSLVTFKTIKNHLQSI